MKKIKCDVCGRTQSVKKGAVSSDLRRDRWFAVVQKADQKITQTICGGDPTGGSFDICLQGLVGDVHQVVLELFIPALTGSYPVGVHLVEESE